MTHDCHEIRFHSICPQRLQFKVMFKRNFCFGFVHSVLEIWQRLDWPSPSLNTPLNSFKPSNLFSTLPFVFLCSRSFNSIQQLELHVLMSWYKVNFSIWTKYLTSIQWWCLMLLTSWSTTSAKTDIFYTTDLSQTQLLFVCLFGIFEYWISQLGAVWWPRAGDLGWWWQNESPRQQCSTSSRGGYCPRQQCSTVPPSCVLPPPSSVPSSSDIDVICFEKASASC